MWIMETFEHKLISAELSFENTDVETFIHADMTAWFTIDQEGFCRYILALLWVYLHVYNRKEINGMDFEVHWPVFETLFNKFGREVFSEVRSYA